ncbi:MAG: hypothetical protein ACPGYY_04150 [Bacteroidia bacterium]
MTSSNKVRSNITTIAGLLCASVPISIYGIWIYVCRIGETQLERATLFKEYFPSFLGGRWSTTYLSIMFCIMALALCLYSFKVQGFLWKTINIFVLVICSFLLLLNLFSMM